MGTYTTNYNLYIPTVGEQGWGTLVNENFITIDTTMKGLDTRLTAVESEVNGALSCTSVTTSGTITSSGKITANGGIGTTSLTTSNTITSTGLIVGNGGFRGIHYVPGVVGTSGDELYATCAAISITGTEAISSRAPGSFTVNNYSISYGNPKKHMIGVYTRRADLTGVTNPSSSTRTVTIKNNGDSAIIFYYKLSTASSYSATSNIAGYATTTLSLTTGKTYNWYATFANNDLINKSQYCTITSPSSIYYVKYTTP